MDNENVVYIRNGILLNHKNKFVATSTDHEGIKLNEINQDRE